MTHSLKTTALLTLLMCGSHASFAESTTVDDLKTEVKNTAKQCQDLIKPVKEDGCVWDDASIKTCEKIAKGDPEKEFLCEAFEAKERKFTKEDYYATLAQFDQFTHDKEKNMTVLIHDYESLPASKKDFAKLASKISDQRKELGTGCKNMVNGLKGYLDPLFKLYEEFGGKSCKRKRRSS